MEIKISAEILGLAQKIQLSELTPLCRLVCDNPDKNWDYDYVSQNHNITWEIVKNNPDKDWHYGRLSLNPNITWEIVQNNPDKKWGYDNLSFNPFTAELTQIREKLKTKAVIRIQRWYIKIYYRPDRYERILLMKILIMVFIKDY